MLKRGQLLAIQFHYFMIGFVIGVVAGAGVLFLSASKIIPFKIPVICGLFLPKKGQLEIIEFKDFVIGFVVGFALVLGIVYLSTLGIIPFKIPMLC